MNPFADLDSGSSTKPDAAPVAKSRGSAEQKAAPAPPTPQNEFANLLESGPEPTASAGETDAPAPRAGSPTAVILGLIAVLFGLIGIAVPWLAVTLITKAALVLGAAGLLFALAGIGIARFQRAGAAFPMFGLALCALASLVAGAVLLEVIDPGTLLGDSRQAAAERNKQLAANEGSAPEASAKEIPAKPEKDVKKEPPARPEIAEWIDASQKLPAALGTMRVRVLGARIEGVKGKNLDPALEKGTFLQVRVQIEIISDDRTIAYRGWGVPPPMAGQPVPRLTDDLQPPTEYKPIHFGPTAVVEGQVAQGSIRTDQPLTDLLVFEPPADPVKVLHLELPAANFGANGKLRFKVPRSMIVAKAIPTPAPPPTKPPPVTPAAPADPKLLAELQKALKDPKAADRAEVIAKLASLGGGAAAAVPDLATALKDKDEPIRAAAAEAIGKIAPKTAQAKTAVPALVLAMQDQSKKVRIQSAIALGRIGKDAYPAAGAVLLTAMVSDEDPEVKSAAEAAARQISPIR